MNLPVRIWAGHQLSLMILSVTVLRPSKKRRDSVYTKVTNTTLHSLCYTLLTNYLKTWRYILWGNDGVLSRQKRIIVNNILSIYWNTYLKYYTMLKLFYTTNAQLLYRWRFLHIYSVTTWPGLSFLFRTSPLILLPFDGNKGMVGWLNNYFLGTKRPWLKIRRTKQKCS